MSTGTAGLVRGVSWSRGLVVAITVVVLGAPLLRHVAEHEHSAGDDAGAVADRRGAVGNRLLGAVATDQRRVIR